MLQPYEKGYFEDKGLFVTFEVLSGHAVTGQRDPGAILCDCESVGILTLRDAIAGGARTVASLRQATSAETNCGSCRAELGSLLGDAAIKVAAE